MLASSTEIRLGTGTGSGINLSEELAGKLSDVCKQCLLGVQDLTAELIVPPQFPVAGGGFSDVYRGTLNHLDAERKVSAFE